MYQQLDIDVGQQFYLFCFHHVAKDTAVAVALFVC